MTVVHYNRQAVSLNDDESVLEGLIRHGISVNHGCRSGVCQSCMMVADHGDAPDNAQIGLTQNQKALNYFLSCICHPQKALTVSSLDSEALTHSARVEQKRWLNDRVMAIRLSSDITFKAGQYLTLWKDNRLGRSYSIASIEDEGFIELHIKHLSDGKLSPWICNTLAEGDKVNIQGPMGLCFYNANRAQPMLLASMSTGLAPIYGILKDALAQGHSAPIHVFVGSQDSSEFYLVQELLQLQDKHSNLQLTFIAKKSHGELALEVDFYRYLQSEFTDLSNYRVYVCGSASFVGKVTKISFLLGAAMGNISADRFLPFSKP